MLERMEEGGNAAERAMAAKYAKAIKADQVMLLVENRGRMCWQGQHRTVNRVRVSCMMLRL